MHARELLARRARRFDAVERGETIVRRALRAPPADAAAIPDGPGRSCAEACSVRVDRMCLIQPMSGSINRVSIRSQAQTALSAHPLRSCRFAAAIVLSATQSRKRRFLEHDARRSRMCISLHAREMRRRKAFGQHAPAPAIRASMHEADLAVDDAGIPARRADSRTARVTRRFRFGLADATTSSPRIGAPAIAVGSEGIRRMPRRFAARCRAARRTRAPPPRSFRVGACAARAATALRHVRSRARARARARTADPKAG